MSSHSEAPIGDVLLVGAGGFVGVQLYLELSSKFNVIPCVRAKDNGVEQFCGRIDNFEVRHLVEKIDVTRPETLRELASKYRPKFIVYSIGSCPYLVNASQEYWNTRTYKGFFNVHSAFEMQNPHFVVLTSRAGGLKMGRRKDYPTYWPKIEQYAFAQANMATTLSRLRKNSAIHIVRISELLDNSPLHLCLNDQDLRPEVTREMVAAKVLDLCGELSQVTGLTPNRSLDIFQMDVESAAA